MTHQRQPHRHDPRLHQRGHLMLAERRPKAGPTSPPSPSSAYRRSDRAPSAAPPVLAATSVTETPSSGTSSTAGTAALPHPTPPAHPGTGTASADCHPGNQSQDIQHLPDSIGKAVAVGLGKQLAAPSRPCWGRTRGRRSRVEFPPAPSRAAGLVSGLPAIGVVAGCPAMPS
jgi:hypothetical protein